MKTIAVTMGFGQLHSQMARWSAHRVKHYLNLETRFVDESHLSYAVPNTAPPENFYTLKFSFFDIFPDVDRIVYFDSDWRPVRHFNLDDYCPDPTRFYAAPDRGAWSEPVAKVAQSYGINPHDYFNAGFFVATRKHHHAMFQKCKNQYHSMPKTWHDQCVLNQLFKNEVTLLPRKLNTMDFGAIPANEVLGFHHGTSIFVAAKKTADYNWDADNSAAAVGACSTQDVYEKLCALDYSHLWVTDYAHILDVYQYAKDYAGQNALEVGSFQGHGGYALHLAGLNVRSIDHDTTYFNMRKFTYPGVVGIIGTGEQELTFPAQYAVIFHDSYHGEKVVPEIVEFWQKKLIPGGLLIVHDTDSFNLTNFLEKLGNPVYKNTFDSRGRGLGFFWKPRQ